VVHEGDGSTVMALQRAQIGEQWCDLAGDILVNRVQAYKRVED
jgi:hypothetical protein